MMQVLYALISAPIVEHKRLPPLVVDRQDGRPKLQLSPARTIVETKRVCYDGWSISLRVCVSSKAIATNVQCQEL